MKTESRPNAPKQIRRIKPDWDTPKKAYQCEIRVYPEDNGMYSAYAANLPGVASFGPTEDEAISNVTEALSGAIATYLESGEKIPWAEVGEASVGEKKRWVTVHG